jgi:hypothetical protein
MGMDAVDQVLKYFGSLVLTAGAAGTIAYAIFRFLGKSWVESKFAERLEAFKHQQALEIQRLRVEIESMLSGALKLQELEFEVLPEAWKRLDEATGRARFVISSVQEYENVETASDLEFEEVLQKTLPNLLESQRASLRAADPRDRAKQYQKLIAWKHYNHARKALFALDEYIASKGLFLPAPLKDQFRKIITIIQSSLGSYRTALEYDVYKLRGEAGTAIAAVEPLIQSIEKEIGERLQSHARK